MWYLYGMYLEIMSFIVIGEKMVVSYVVFTHEEYR